VPDREDAAWTEDELLARLQREHAENAKRGAEMRGLLLQHERLLCQKVAQLREERGWSQAELARRLSAIGFEMHQTTVAKLESGKRPLRVAEVFALAEVFGLPPLAMFRMPVQGEDFGMDYMRDRLKDIDEHLETMTETSMRTLEAFAKNYAELSANRLVMADNMRRAAAEQAKGDDDGEHQEET
jgi:transcriptional regulator with XRE-family HTH domain